MPGDRPPHRPHRSALPPLPRAIPKDDMDEPTPVTGVPIAGPPRTPEPLETIAHRTRATATDAKETLLTIGMMRTDLVNAIKRDELEHSAIRESIDKSDRRFSQQAVKLDGKIDRMSEQVADLRETTARTEIVMQTLLDDWRAARQTEHVRRRVTIETQAAEERAEIEDTADAKKLKRQLKIKVMGLVTAVGAALAAGITALLQQCGT